MRQKPRASSPCVAHNQGAGAAADAPGVPSMKQNPARLRLRPSRLRLAGAASLCPASGGARKLDSVDLDFKRSSFLVVRSGVRQATVVALLAVLGVMVVASMQAVPAAQEAAAPASRAVTDAAVARTVLDRYCVTCHNQRLKTAGVSLDTLDLTALGNDAELSEKVVRKLRAREMPPPGAPRPPAAELARTATWLESVLDVAAATHPNPGRVAVHRLNRREYTNAIRDLLGLELDQKTLLADDEPDQQSFENLASVLSVSPALVDNYLAAAYRVSRLAMAGSTTSHVVDTYTVPMNLVQDERVGDDLPFGSQGGLFVTHHFPTDGDYKFAVTLRAAMTASRPRLLIKVFLKSNKYFAYFLRHT